MNARVAKALAGNEAFLAGGGDMGARIRAFDWTATPFGPPGAWPASLRSCVSLMLGSSFPTAIYWGREFRLLYNDAWAPIAGERHPAALGQAGAEVWADIWDVVGPQFVGVYESGEGFATFDQMLPMTRRGAVAETYWNYSLTPIRDELGEVVGILNQGNETTARVFGERRQAFRLALEERMREVADPREALHAASELLGRTLGALRVGYAEAEAPGHVTVERDWTAPGAVSAAGRHVLDQYGAALAAELAAARTVRIADIAADPLTKGGAAAFAGLDLRALLVAPLVRDGDLSGLLYVHDSRPRAWTDYEVELVALVAERTWSAVQRMRAEARLRESETRFRTLFDALDDAIAIFDRLPGEPRDWRYVVVNPSFAKLFGRADAEGLTIREVFASADEGWFDIFDEVAASGKAVRFSREGLSQTVMLEMFVAPVGLGPAGTPRLLATARDVTAMRRTQAALERSEERLRLATDAAEVGFWDVDEVNKTLTWPPLVKRMFGIPADEPVSMADFYAGLHPLDRDRVAAAYAAAADPARRALYDVEYRTVGRDDGEVRWVAAKGRGVFDARGRCLRVIGTAIDITARKAEAARLEASEAALGETTATLNASLEYAPIGFAFVDRELRYVRVNGTLARINGRTPADHVGRRVAEIAPKTAAAAAADLARMFATGEPAPPLEVEDIAPWAPRELRTWLTSFFPVFDAAGAVQYVGATVIDITERKRAEAALRELNEGLERRVAEALAEKRRLAEVIDRTDIFVQVADPDYNWLAINEAAANEFARIFGVPKPKAGDNMLSALDHAPEHREAVRAVWARAMAGEEFVEVQEFGDSARDRRFYEMRFRTLRDGEGRAVGAYQFVSDVTERVSQQRRLAEAEAALAQAQKMDAVGQLTGGVAHDFNNLLQGVAGSFDLIRRKPDDPARVTRWAEAGLQAAERGAKLTSQLLAFSRSQKLEAKPISAPALLRNMRDLLERTLGPTYPIVFDLDEDAPPVLADATQLELAVLNLAINARDAMAGGGALTISVRRREIGDDPELKAGEYVELAVADSGAGMAAEVAARAFEPFFTTKGVGKGTGLGLAQVYGIARAAGGVARIESLPGRGTTVRLLLPRTDRLPDPAAAVTPEAQDAPRAATVLVVDDDPDVRRFLKDSLEGLGFAVLIAEDGPGGLEVLAREAPDLLLLDYAMPGMSGAEVFRIARERRPGLPILLTSGYADAQAIAKAGGGDAKLLRKPFRIEELRAAIAEALGWTPG